MFARKDYVEEAWRIVDPVCRRAPRSMNTRPRARGPSEVDRRVVPSRRLAQPDGDRLGVRWHLGAHHRHADVRGIGAAQRAAGNVGVRAGAGGRSCEGTVRTSVKESVATLSVPSPWGEGLIPGAMGHFTPTLSPGKGAKQTYCTLLDKHILLPLSWWGGRAFMDQSLQKQSDGNGLIVAQRWNSALRNPPSKIFLPTWSLRLVRRVPLSIGVAWD